ncbi:programmed cell death protein 6-like [Diadema antillarum]|uniref:programmed cell death protein 6-like n=1 Tax=Diadema antillarum TaxID=105358 RepID=UPI003A84DB83
MAYPGAPGQYGQGPGAPPMGGPAPGATAPPQGYPGAPAGQGYPGQFPPTQGQAPPPQGQGFPGQAPNPAYAGQTPQGYAGQAPAPGQGYPGHAPPPQQPYGQQPGYGAACAAQPPGAYQQGAPGAAPPGAYHPAHGTPGGAPGAPGGVPPGMDPELCSWFTAVDQDNSGQVTAKELQQALTNANWTTFDEATCRHMIGIFDQDKTGTINMREFAALWDYIQQWKRVFEGFDADKSGGINATEFQQALNQQGYRFSPAFCQMAVARFDTVNHSELKLDGYMQISALIRYLTDEFRRRDKTKTGVINIAYEDFVSIVVGSKT